MNAKLKEPNAALTKAKQTVQLKRIEMDKANTDIPGGPTCDTHPAKHTKVTRLVHCKPIASAHLKV